MAAMCPSMASAVRDLLDDTNDSSDLKNLATASADRVELRASLQEVGEKWAAIRGTECWIT